MSDAFIYDHVRTPRGKGRADGALHEITPISLVSQTLSALRNRNCLDTGLVEDLILGCVTPVGEQGADIARSAAIVADYAETVPGQQINRFCTSALDAVNTASAMVKAGAMRCVVAGGVESMSRVRMGSDGGAWFTDPQTTWKLRYVPQGISADLIATLEGHSREEVDAYAVESQRRAAHARDAGWFDGSLTPVRDAADEIVLTRDEAIRAGTTPEDLATLKPAFAHIGAQNGFDAVALQRYPQVEALRHVHTAGNSSGIVDGAAAILIGDGDFAGASGLKPRARIRGFTVIGSEPTIMLTGPVACSRMLLKRLGMTVQDIDLYEINEAFASVPLHYMRGMGISPEITNVNGDAIALGHPMGATGAMLLGTVLDELERRDRSTALVTLCAAAGMATATVIERV
jgi:acetyl-CoA C-acetyltransferase